MWCKDVPSCFNGEKRVESKWKERKECSLGAEANLVNFGAIFDALEDLKGTDDLVEYLENCHEGS